MQNLDLESSAALNTISAKVSLLDMKQSYIMSKKLSQLTV
mgnify:CR=1 FL=1